MTISEFYKKLSIIVDNYTLDKKEELIALLEEAKKLNLSIEVDPNLISNLESLIKNDNGIEVEENEDEESEDENYDDESQEYNDDDSSYSY
jgi:hypothetical protein